MVAGRALVDVSEGCCPRDSTFVVVGADAVGANSVVAVGAEEEEYDSGAGGPLLSPPKVTGGGPGIVNAPKSP